MKIKTRPWDYKKENKNEDEQLKKATDESKKKDDSENENHTPEELNELTIEQYLEMLEELESKETERVKVDSSWIKPELKKPIQEDYKFLHIEQIYICPPICESHSHWLYAPTYEKLIKMYANENYDEPKDAILTKEDCINFLEDVVTCVNHHCPQNFLDLNFFDGVDELEKAFKAEKLEFSRKHIKTSLKNAKKHTFSFDKE